MKLFDASSARTALQESRRLNVDNANRVLLHITNLIAHDPSSGVLQVIGNVQHTNKIVYNVFPISFGEIQKAWRSGSDNTRIVLNDAGIKFVMDSLKELGYDIFGYRQSSRLVDFTISWT